MFENFRSLTYHVTGGIAAIDEELTIAGGQITRAVRGQIGDNTAPLSPDEMAGLIEVLERADLPRLKLRFCSSQIMDGLDHTLTVTVGTGKAKKSYCVTNGSSESPEGYGAVVKYLHDLQNDKFRPPR